MDRPIFWPGSVPRSLDMNLVGRNTMTAMGELMLDLFGSSTFCTGLACTPTAPASLAVQVAGGRIYSLQNLEATPISTGVGQLAADTAHQIIKQGINLGASTIPCAAPVTTGQSINYLIEAQYADQDTNLSVLPYFNATPPNTPLSGPAGLGASNATTRAGIVSLQAKAGIPSATGTQTTPSVDSGWVGLYVVTVVFGATTITSGNISTASGAPISTPGGLYPALATSGSFATTAAGFSGTAPTGTIKWHLSNGKVTLIIPALSGTSNAATFTLNGLPVALQPLTSQTMAANALIDNGGIATAAGIQVVPGSGFITLFISASPSAWTTSGTKGISSSTSVTYALL